MKKKVISLLLVAAMVGTMLTGCGGSSEEPTAEGEATEEVAEEPAEESAEEGVATTDGTVGTNTFVEGGTE